MATSCELTQFQPLVNAASKFGLDLFHRLREKTSDKNLFFSPYSISVALAMTHLGCRGDTFDQIATATYLKDFPDYHKAFAAMNEVLFAGANDYTLRTANRLFGHESYSFLDEFLAAVRTHYKSEIERMDFGADVDACRQKINRWVEEQTADKIKDLIQPGILNSLTRLVLVNAIYFKGNWASQFDKKLTERRKFYVDGKNSVEVEMMRETSKNFNFAHDKKRGFKTIELPYVEKRLSMFVALPDKRDGLRDLETRLDADLLAGIVAEGRPIKVKVVLPKFKFEAGFSLNEVLAAMGIKDLFSDTDADLSAMDGTRMLFISKALTKAFIDVNEEGSEAAAATSMVAMLRCAPMKREDPPEFIADHPFLFLIRDNRTGAILFMGHVMNPSA